MNTHVKLRDNQLYASDFTKRLDKWRRQINSSLGKKITRGHGYIMSSFMEDLFAQYLEKLLGDAVDQILVDTTININGKTVRPDIILIKNRTVIGFFDCKTTLWDRGGVHKMAKTYLEYLREIHKNGGTIKIAIDIPEIADPTSKSSHYSVANSASWDVIIAGVWGKSKNGTVMEQIDSWNQSPARSETKIWHITDYTTRNRVFNENVFIDIKERILKMDTNLERKNSEYAQFLFQHGEKLDVNDSKIGYFTQKTIVGDIFGVKIPKVYMKSGFKINDVYELSFMNDEGTWENIIHKNGSIEMLPQATLATPNGLKWYQNVLPDKDKNKKLIVFYRADGKYHFMGVFKWDEKCFAQPEYKMLEKVSSTITKSDLSI